MHFFAYRSNPASAREPDQFRLPRWLPLSFAPSSGRNAQHICWTLSFAPSSGGSAQQLFQSLPYPIASGLTCQVPLNALKAVLVTNHFQATTSKSVFFPYRSSSHMLFLLYFFFKRHRILIFAVFWSGTRVPGAFFIPWIRNEFYQDPQIEPKFLRG